MPRREDVITLTIFSRPGCRLCQDMKQTAERVVRAAQSSAHIEEINIANDPELEARYGLEIPVLLVNGRKTAKYRVTEEALRRLLLSSTSL